ncbi:MAG: 50S ribosomal protein L17 [Cyclobacteriaceae bacterium]
MRHGKKFNHLGRTASHRSAMLSNMASSLILHKRITTTVAKAKALRKYVEPLITKSKTDSTHSRRTVFSYLQNKDSVKILFDEVAEKVATRPGGYTRIIRMGSRLGDNADMCLVELVDYNELLLKETAGTKSRTRRRKKSSSSTEAKADTKKEEVAAVKETEVKAEAEEASVATAETDEVVEDSAAEEQVEDQSSDDNASTDSEEENEEKKS